MNTFDNIDNDCEPTASREHCIYCNAVYNVNNPELPYECTGDCGENPDEFNDINVTKELEF